MKLYTSYFANYKNIPVQYQCVSIANSKPTSLFIPTWSLVMPEYSLVEKLKTNQINWLTFNIHYKNYLNSLWSEQFTKYLSRFNADAVALLCWEKDATHCHRSVLAEHLSKALVTCVSELV